MSPGEYRAASLGSLAIILAALVIWAALWGPGDDDCVPGDDVAECD